MIAQVIKYEGNNQTFIWKHPCEDFNSGTQLKECANDSDAPYGFFVCAISREDIANHFEGEVVEEFDKLSKKKKEILLSNIADEMNDVYQENNFSDNFDNICFENTMNT